MLETAFDLKVLKGSLIKKFGFLLLETKRFKHNNNVPAWKKLPNSRCTQRVIAQVNNTT